MRMGLESPPSIAADIVQVCERVTRTHAHTYTHRVREYAYVRMRERKYTQWVKLAYGNTAGAPYA